MIFLSVCPLYRTAHETVAAKCLNDYHLTATMLHLFLLVKLLIERAPQSESHLVLKPEDRKETTPTAPARNWIQRQLSGALLEFCVPKDTGRLECCPISIEAGDFKPLS